VLVGDMSLVGPRPNVEREVAIYTKEERRLLEVRPGITDLASIVFSDEGEILADAGDADIKYNQVIRPWKSRLGLLYVEKRSLTLDFVIIGFTVIAILSRSVALSGVQKILEWLRADAQLRRVALRQEALQPYPPPGSDQIVTNRNFFR
jgi:lipopolysaccharide/colanic/teichoic acid biosynthesis glycosyltransferase